MSRWSPKDPADANVLYRVDWSPFLAPGETLSTKTVTAATGLTAGTATIVGNSVVIPLSGGTDGTNYDITVTVTTSAGQTFKLVKPILVKSRILRLDN